MEIKIVCQIENNYKGGVFPIYIYNKEKQLFFKGKTQADGTLKIYLPKREVFKIIVTSKWETVNIVLWVSENLDIPIPILLHKPASLINFILKDAFYENLPIEKGGILLWPNNTPFP